MRAERAPEDEGLPPGPRIPPLLATPMVLGPKQPFLDWCRGRYGDIFTVRTMPPFGTLVFVADPEAIREVFRGDPAGLRAGAANSLLEPVLGHSSILRLDDSAHLDMRKLMLPPFHGRAIAEYATLIEGIAADAVASWPRGRPFALHPRLQELTLEVILRAVIGTRDEDRLERLRVALPRLVDIAPWQPLAWQWPALQRFGPWRRFRQGQTRARELLIHEIAGARDDPAIAGRDDVLALLVAARTGEGVPLTDDQLHDQLVTLLLAGHEKIGRAHV
jgi:cytochrome P450